MLPRDRAIDLDERLEQARDLLRFNADTRVDDLTPHHDFAVDVFGHPDVDAHHALFRELNGVADHVGQYLEKAPWIAIQRVWHRPVD
jgi:hypothetical protein